MIETHDTDALLETVTDQPVLVATDFSKDSKAALQWACRFADGSGARLVILHVVHDLAAHPGFYQRNKTEHMESMQNVAESMMDEFLAPLRAGTPEIAALKNADLLFVPGLPPSRIVEVAGLLSASLIAIGGRGVTCMPHRLLGATAERVAELSRIPVVIIKSAEHDRRDKKEIKRKKKRLKKDRKRLKELLGLGNIESTEGRINE
jgi:nucleotide-binding universal stress UspA family protein